MDMCQTRGPPKYGVTFGFPLKQGQNGSRRAKLPGVQGRERGQRRAEGHPPPDASLVFLSFARPRFSSAIEARQGVRRDVWMFGPSLLETKAENGCRDFPPYDWCVTLRGDPSCIFTRFPQPSACDSNRNQDLYRCQSVDDGIVSFPFDIDPLALISKAVPI